MIMPMIAIMANLPLASSADNFLVFSAGSLELRTLKPKSPVAALVPVDLTSTDDGNVGNDTGQHRGLLHQG